MVVLVLGWGVEVMKDVGKGLGSVSVSAEGEGEGEGEGILSRELSRKDSVRAS